jgi:hypothetical protein
MAVLFQTGTELSQAKSKFESNQRHERTGTFSILLIADDSPSPSVWMLSRGLDLGK